jgi:O-antigen/teichoic acid export membrane protein
VVAVVTISSSLLNIGLNYVLIRTIGMQGAALATCISHGVQLLMHYVYARYIIKGDYPFPVGMWWKYGAVYLLAVAVFYLLPGMWLLRWGLGAAIGLWELWRIKKRKVLI